MKETQTKSPDKARSKILRLAFRDRMAFNRLVRDGYKGAALIDWLAQHGVPGVNGENLRIYKRSPSYREWLAEEKDVDRDREATEQAMRLAEAVGGSASERLKTILAGKMYRLLQGVQSPEESRSIVECMRAIVEAERVEVQRQQVSQREAQISLQRDKQASETCKLFLKWYADEEARRIAGSRSSNADKIDALRKKYFSDVDALDKAGEVQLPA